MIVKICLMSAVLIGFSTALEIGNVQNFMSEINNKRGFLDNPCIGQRFAINTRGCSWFWVCNEENVTISQNRCPEGYHFNVAEQNCDYKDHANCQLGLQAPSECPEETGIQAIPHPLVCSKFTG